MHLLSFGTKCDMAAGFFCKKYRKGTKYSFVKVLIPKESPFYQLFINNSHNFSTHLLTVLTIRCIVIVSVEQTKHAFRYDHKISEVINNTDYDNNVRYFHVFEAAWSKVIER